MFSQLYPNVVETLLQPYIASWVSSNSREIKYQNIGRTHTQTHRQTDIQTGSQQYLVTPSEGEVITKASWDMKFDI